MVVEADKHCDLSILHLCFARGNELRLADRLGILGRDGETVNANLHCP